MQGRPLPLSVLRHALLPLWTQQGSRVLAKGFSRSDLCICYVDRQEIPFYCPLILTQLKPG